MRVFAQYFDGKPSGLNPPAIIRNNLYFQDLRVRVSDSITEDYANAREYVKVRDRGTSILLSRDTSGVMILPKH